MPFQTVEILWWDNMVVLQASYHDTRRDSQPPGETIDVLVAEMCSFGAKLSKFIRRDQKIR